MSVTEADIREFLSLRSLAIAGVSRGGKKLGNAIYRSFKTQGYKMFVLHQEAESLEGERCYASLALLPEKVEGLILSIPPVQAERVLADAFAAGVRHVWLQRGSESYSILRFCEKNDIKAIHGYCPLMFVEPVDSIHAFHRWLSRLFGSYPEKGVHTSAQSS